MIVYNTSNKFEVLGMEINLISDETCYGLNTVAEVNDQLHYLGSEHSSISTAIFLWQELNGRELTNEELRQTLEENQILEFVINL